MKKIKDFILICLGGAVFGPATHAQSLSLYVSGTQSGGTAVEYAETSSD